MPDIPWLHPRFILYPDAYSAERFAHIATPEWVKRPDSLFQCNGETLCGAGESRSKARGLGYYRSGERRNGDLDKQILDAVPEGVKVCRQCLAHLAKEYLPYVEDDDE